MNHETKTRDYMTELEIDQGLIIRRLTAEVDSLRAKYARLETKYVLAFERVAELSDKELDDLVKYPSTHNLQENLPRLVQELKVHRAKFARIRAELLTELGIDDGLEGNRS